MTWIVRLFVLMFGVAATATTAAAASEPEALERAVFRTFAYLYQTAPVDTVTALTDCVVEALSGAPDDVVGMLIEVDKSGYAERDRRLALRQLLAAGIDQAAFSACGSEFEAGNFGPTTGAELPATAAPAPEGANRCPLFPAKETVDSLSCYCPPLTGGAAYGFKTYTADSGICIAARHAGAIDFLVGGMVDVNFSEGCASYPSVTANGYTSGDEKQFDRSFYFPAIGPGECPK